MAWFLAALKGLLSLGKLGWLFSWLPASLAFLGPVGPILGAIVGFIGQIIGWALEGLTVIISKPVTLVTVALIATVTWGFGLDFGLRFDHHKVEVRDAKIASMAKAQKDRDVADSKLATAAKAAREKAESEAVKQPTAAAPAVNPGSPAPERVRVKRSSKSDNKQGVWGISTLPW